MAQEEIHVS